MKSRKIYIEGKITGEESTVYKRFSHAEYQLKTMGFIPVNPLFLSPDDDNQWESYIRESIKHLVDCDGIYLLEGWETSRDALLRYNIAKSLNFLILDQAYLQTLKQ